MRSYDVYRGDNSQYKNLRARIRVQDDGQIEWAFRPQGAAWTGFWWNESTKAEIVRMIKEYPERAEFPVKEFTICRRDEE